MIVIVAEALFLYITRSEPLNHAKVRGHEIKLGSPAPEDNGLAAARLHWFEDLQLWG